jgi:NADH dehydrogenase
MINIPETDKKRIVIIGCGFAGLRLARKLKTAGFQIVMIDKYNFHQFQPLFYQVAIAGLEPSAISFPLRKIFQGFSDYFIRIAKVTSIDPAANTVHTTLGSLLYDYLVLSYGADTSYFGMENVRNNSLPMKSLAEAVNLRNRILQNFEDALNTKTEEEREPYMNIVVVGGGPSGVELSGSLAEMRNYILPKDYPELDCDKINIHLIEATNRLLGGMSSEASHKAFAYLSEKLSVKVKLNTLVKNYEDGFVQTSDGNAIKANLVIWTAGIKINKLEGLNEECFGPSGRILVNSYNLVEGYDNIFAIGDAALMKTGQFPKGHPQVAQVAIQQADNLAENLPRLADARLPVSFEYKNLGSMATIGRNLAVVDLPHFSFSGLIAWLFWMFVHLMAIVGVKNRLLIFINWLWNYVTYDQSLRLIINHKKK